MAKIELNDLVDFLYSRFPNIYRKKDEESNYNLYNFLASMLVGYPLIKEDGTEEHIEGAGERLLRLANDFTKIIDPETCPESILPFMVYSFGLMYNKDIETKTDDKGNPIIYYHRKYLKYIGALTKRMGTISGLRFLVRVLTGFEFEYTYKREISDEGVYGRFLEIHLIVGGTEEANKVAESKAVIEQFLKPFIPFYINLGVGESINYRSMDNYDYRLVPTPSYSVDYYLKRKKEDSEQKGE